MSASRAARHRRLDTILRAFAATQAIGEGEARRSRLVLGVLGTMALALVACLVLRQHLAMRVAVTESAMQADLAASGVRSLAVESSHRLDYVSRLPAAADADRLIQLMHKASLQRQVSLIQVAVTPSTSVPDRLTRTDLRIVTRGKYVDTKAFVGDLLGFHSAPLLQRIDLRRMSPSTDVEARIDLTLLARPARSEGKQS